MRTTLLVSIVVFAALSGPRFIDDPGCTLPGFPGDAGVVSIVDRDSAPAIALHAGASIVWTQEIDRPAQPMRLGTLPDLNGDSIAEIRVGVVSPDSPGVSTLILSGIDGRQLFEIASTDQRALWPDSEEGSSYGEFPSEWPDSIALDSPLRTLGGDSAEVNALRKVLREWRRDAGARGQGISEERDLEGLKPTRGEPRGNGGEPDGDELTVKLYEVTFAGSHMVTRDAAAQLNYPPVWRDANLDGDADDWGTISPWATSFPGDIRAPLCYTVGQKLKASTAKFKVSEAYAIPTTATVIGRVIGATQVDVVHLSRKSRL